MLGQASYTRTEGAASQRNHVRFFMETIEVPNPNGGLPFYREEERAEIIMPGIANLTKPVERVTDFHRQEYAREYEAFTKGLEAPVDGTPIEEWPRLRPAHVRELRAREIRTIEDIANLSDVGLQQVNLMGIHELRNLARAYLDDADRMALTERLAKENDDLRSEIAAQKHQIEELGQLTRQLHSDFMATRNAPNALNTVIPGMIDPMQAGGYDSPGTHSEPAPQSSLAAFADSKRPGRRKAAEADA